MDHPDEAALVHRLRRACMDEDARQIVFILGSGSSAGSIPATSEMVDYFEQSISNDTEDLVDFRAAVADAEQSRRYQTAARFLIERAGLDHLNRVVRLAVLRARSPRMQPGIARSYLNDEQRLRELEDDYAGWAIPQGATAIGRILSRIPPEMRGPVITTNFDPLVEVSLRACGIEPFTIQADGDGGFAPPEGMLSVVPVIHLHGYWRQGDTLHTSTQLQNARPKLLGSLRQTLTNSTSIVLGYGGWDDVFTRALFALIEEGKQRDLDVLWASHGDTPSLGTLSGADIPGRLQPYVGVDVNRMLPAVDKALASRSRPTTTSALRRRNRAQLHGLTLVDRDLLATVPRDATDERSALSYFDGREPTWSDVALMRAPILDAAQDLIDRVAVWEFDRPGLLLYGPTGEGKSTILRQVGQAFSERTEYEIWWCEKGRAPDADALLNMTETSVRRVVILDDADLQMGFVRKVLDGIVASGRSDIRVLMAARDTDWSRALRLEPATPLASTIRQVDVKGFSVDDARVIVDKWGTFGQKGLGRLAGISTSAEVQAEYLYRQSLENNESALLGAMLASRFGDDFKAHIRQLLDRLERFEVPGRFTLLDAYFTICLAFDLELGPVRLGDLSQLVGLSEKETMSLIVRRLGFEAATYSHGTAIAPRHRNIGHTVTMLMEEYGASKVQVLRRYISAVTASAQGRVWDASTIALAYSGQRIQSPDLALAAVEGAVDGDSLQLRLRTAEIGRLREFGLIPRALERAEESWGMFDRMRDTNISARRFFREWARVSGRAGDQFQAAALNVVALVDHERISPIDVSEASRALSALALCIQQWPEAQENPETRAWVAALAGVALDIASDEEVRVQARSILKSVGKDADATAPHENWQLIRSAFHAALTRSAAPPTRRFASAERFSGLESLLSAH